MNKSTAIFLVRKDVRCISVAYDKANDRVTGKTVGTDIKSFKTVDPDIKAKDLVLIPTDSRWGFTVGRVEEIDLHVDFDSSEQMRWIVAKVDLDQYNAIVTAEAGMMDTVAEADRAHREAELAAKLFSNVDPAALAAFHIAGPAAPTPSGFEPEKRGGAQSGHTQGA